jgi:hypothetical protein
VKIDKASLQKAKKTLLKYRPSFFAALPGLAACVLLGFVLNGIRVSEIRLTELIETRALEQKELSTRHHDETLAVISEESASLHNAVGDVSALVTRLNAVYSQLLEAQKRRTLEGLYEEDALSAQRREAAAAFSAGRYVTSSRLYGEIAAAHQDDQEARFFQYYALFLSNRQNRDNYRAIQDAFTLLERQGFTRREITEALAFIEEETGGPAAEEEP